MVVDDIEDDAEAEVVRAIDEASQIVRCAVQMARRVEIDAVVAPSVAAGKLRDRHHLDGGDPEVGQRRQMLDRGKPGAFLA